MTMRAMTMIMTLKDSDGFSHVLLSYQSLVEITDYNLLT